MPEAGKNYGWPVITYGRDYSFTEDRRGHARRPAWSSRSTTGTRRSPPRARPSTPAIASRNGRATCSSAPWPARRCTAWCSTAREIVGEEKLLADLGRAHPRRAQRPRRRPLAAHRQPAGARAARGAAVAVAAAQHLAGRRANARRAIGRPRSSLRRINRNGAAEREKANQVPDQPRRDIDHEPLPHPCVTALQVLQRASGTVIRGEGGPHRPPNSEWC